MKKTIPNEVLDVMKHCRCDGNKFFIEDSIGNPILDRATYQKLAKVLEMLGGKWNRGQKAHLFTDDCAEMVDAAVMTGEVTDYKKLYQFFETPPELADQLIRMADVEREYSYLEPSAGRGAIVKALQRVIPNAVPTVCELDPQNVAHLQKLPVCLTHADFLRNEFPDHDRIIMNPPFRNGQDIEHVRHAFKFLRPGGRLVAITSPSWQYRENGKYKQFRDWLDELPHEVEEVPAGAFASSGTDIRTLIVTINKR